MLIRLFQQVDENKIVEKCSNRYCLDEASRLKWLSDKANLWLYIIKPGMVAMVKTWIGRCIGMVMTSLRARRFSFSFHAHRSQFTDSARIPTHRPGWVGAGAVGELAAVCVKGKRETSCTKTMQNAKY